jgi:hypothetical protein
MLKLSSVNIISFILFFHCIISPVKADEFYFYNNVVKITTIQPDNDDLFGFGFIVYEEDNFYYIATAKHLVQTENEPVIEIRFYKPSLIKTASVAHLHKELDLALLKVEKPDSFHAWEFCSITKDPEIGDKIKIIGRYGGWSESSNKTKGEIISVSQNQFRAIFYGAAVGSSGGPVVSGKNIVGMIIYDEGNQIIAIPIAVIEDLVREYKELNSLKIKDLPILGFGVNIGGSCESLFYGRDVNVLKRSSAIPVFNPCIFVEMTFFEHTSFKLETAYRIINKKTNGKYGPYNQFRNHLITYSASVYYNFTPYTQNELRSSDEIPDFPILIIGCGWNKMNPIINIENNGWTALSDQYGAEHQYSENFVSFIIGGAGGYKTDKITLYMNIIFEYFTTKYLYMDIVNPYDVNKKNDWLISASLRIGLIRRPKSTRNKLIR